MNKQREAVKKYSENHKKELILGVAIVVAVMAVIVGIVFIARNSVPRVVYQPTQACDLLTSNKAKDLLGDKTIRSNEKPSVLTGDTAVSSCGYTDGNPDTENMTVAALIVRSGINDKGVDQNKNEFNAGRPKTNVQTVGGIGDEAYFNQALGQLNILNGREWIILSYGVGSAPTANTMDDVVKLAYTVIEQQRVEGKF